ncbi:hypothetical protein CI610_01486 [invertebrate metagenome]|uniref:Uncharacterized protein n=1 Tax=invertebrate metagenome TaxID=1711999 RepID=A0A2H9T8H6_9ZZZZ
MILDLLLSPCLKALNVAELLQCSVDTLRSPSRAGAAYQNLTVMIDLLRHGVCRQYNGSARFFTASGIISHDQSCVAKQLFSLREYPGSSPVDSHFFG